MAIRNEIVVFEDDPTLGEALKLAFQKDGFTVYLTQSASHTEELIHTKPIGVLFIDCLLPDIGGVEFAAELRKKYPPAVLEIILMSGVLTDSSYVKESLKLAEAKHFLKKPFDIDEALALVDKPIVSTENTANISPRKQMYDLFQKSKVSIQDKKNIIENLGEVYGYDLPLVYSLFMDSRASGELVIQDESNKPFATVDFSFGSITSVTTADKDSPIGKLLVEEGYVHPDDLKIAEEDKSSKKFGEKLISNFLVSPHALDIILRFQMNIRLSKTIVDKKYKISFEEKNKEETLSQINQEIFVQYLHDWIASKIPLTWLKAQLMQWNGSKIIRTEYFRDRHPAFDMPLIKVLPGILELFQTGITMQEMIETKKFSEEALYKALLFLLTKGIVAFVEPARVSNEDEQLKIISRLHQQFAGANQSQAYDWMVLMVSGDQSKPDTILSQFKKMMGQEPSTSSIKLKTLYTSLLKTVEGACEYVKSGKRDIAKLNLEKVELERQDKILKTILLAKENLSKGAYKVAFESLKSIQSIGQNTEKFRLYWIWAQIGMLDTNLNKLSAIQAIEMDLFQVPPEDRVDALYSFVNGLICKAKGDKVSAMKMLEKALAIDSSFISAKRELSLLSIDVPSVKSTVSKEAKGLFGLFKK